MTDNRYLDTQLQTTKTAIKLMKRVYGDWSVLSGKLFPKPLPPDEAGTSMEPYPLAIQRNYGKIPLDTEIEESATVQRRYLWTDSFGILNLVSLAQSDPLHRDEYLDAGARLIEATKNTLGRPRSPNLPMRKNQHGVYLGMRIGKVQARSYSDPGMNLDGMYWHYLDKWMFCLARFGQERQNAFFIEAAAQTAKELHPFFFSPSIKNQSSGGLQWKMTTDLKPIPGLPPTEVNDDVISALVVYSVINTAIERFGLHQSLALNNEISELKSVLNGYHSFATADPLGYGLKWWQLQWWKNSQLKMDLLKASKAALNLKHLQLPFRLYGAILGARLSGNEDLNTMAQDLLIKTEPFADKDSESGGPHSSINAVMYCSALLPCGFRRLPSEQDIHT